MKKSVSRITREQRKVQLMEMFQDKRSQITVLRLFSEAQPLGKPLTPGMSIIDIILDHEFGDLNDKRVSGASTGTIHVSAE